MSAQEVDLCVHILEDFFGDQLTQVARLLSTHSPLTLRSIVQYLKGTTSIAKIKRVLLLLAQHNLVTFSFQDDQVYYSSNILEAIRLSCSARCLVIIKTLFGEIAEAICYEIICHGQISCSHCFKKVLTRFDTPAKELLDVFNKLAETQMVIRCPKIVNDNRKCPVFEEWDHPFVVPEISIEALDEFVASRLDENGSDEQEEKKSTSTRKRKHSGNSDSKEENEEENILWRLNYERFERYMRDEFLIDLYSNGDFEESYCLRTVQVIVKMCEMKSSNLFSCIITFDDIFFSPSRKEIGLERKEIENSLYLLNANRNGIIRKVGESAGGMYHIDFAKAIALQCLRNIEAALCEKFDSDSLRIFRLLIEREFITEDQIEKYLLLETKEARKRITQLRFSNFVSYKRLVKGNDFIHPISLLHVDLPSIARMLYSNIVKTLRNIIIRRRHEVTEHRLLIDKNLKKETIILNIENDPDIDVEGKSQQITEVENLYLPPVDREKLEKHRRGQNATFFAQVELEKDLILFGWYCKYQKLAKNS